MRVQFTREGDVFPLMNSWTNRRPSIKQKPPKNNEHKKNAYSWDTESVNAPARRSTRYVHSSCNVQCAHRSDWCVGCHVRSPMKSNGINQMGVKQQCSARTDQHGIAGCQHSNKQHAQRRADNRVFSQFPLFSPQMSHPFDNLRIFTLRKTADYKSIIITVEQGQDEGAHFRFFLGWMRCDEFYLIIWNANEAIFPDRLVFHTHICTVFNWMIMASVRDYLFTSHLNTTGSYFCLFSSVFLSSLYRW